jgi:hypothetical protein
MLQFKSQERPIARMVIDIIQETSQRAKSSEAFVGNCCIVDDDRDESSASSHTSQLQAAGSPSVKKYEVLDSAPSAL